MTTYIDSRHRRKRVVTAALFTLCYDVARMLTR